MSATTLAAFIARCRVLCRPRQHLTDAELLERFTRQRDADAFGQLLERYASLVWGVCRRILHREADCEDAFQAVFLALVRRPDAVDPRQALGAWLHTVAVRVAHRTLAQSRRQQPQAILPEPATGRDVADEVGSRELLRLVDEEIERLPAAVRAPLILCCLEGRTRDEAAAVLGCSVAAVKGRLKRGRELLRRRLRKRGVELPAAFLVLGLTTDRIRAALWAKTMQSALYTPAPAVVSLAEAGISAAAIGKSKLFLVALLLVTSAAGAAGTLLIEKPTEAPEPPQTKPVAAQPKKSETPQTRKDRNGDPLPDGVIARLGTVRWRHGFFVYNLTYSLDGKMIAAVGAGRGITLWDAATGKELRQFPNVDQPTDVAFSPDGKILATSGFFTRLWDVAAGKELRQIEANNFVFSPDGKLVTTTQYERKAPNWDKNSVRIWDVNTGKELRRLDCEQGELCAVACSPDGKLLAVAGEDSTICLWDFAAGTKRQQLAGHKKKVRKIVFSPGSQRLASSSDDGSVRLWDLATGKAFPIPVDKAGEYLTIPISFSPNGSLLGVGCGDGTLRLLDAKDGTEKRRWQAGAMNVRAIAFAPDGKTLASGATWESIRLWDTATGRERHPSEGHHGFIDSLRFSSDGSTLVSISRDTRMIEWDLATHTPCRRFTLPAAGLSPPALSPDGKTLAVSNWANTEVRLWDVATGKPGRLLGQLQKGRLTIAFSPDGRFVAAGGQGQAVYVWDARDGKEVRTFTGFTTPVSRLSFSPDGKSLACGMQTWDNPSGRQAICLWDVASGKELTQFDSRERSLETPVAFSPDGNVLASGAGDRESSMVRLWNAATGKELCRHAGHRETVGAIAFSPDGKLVASGSGSVGRADNSVHIWEAATGGLIRHFEGHHSCVGSVAFSPDGLTVASGAGDSTILLWDITGRRVDGRWHVKPMTPRQLDACWTALADADAAKANDAVWALVATPEQAVPFLQKHLAPVPRPDDWTPERLRDHRAIQAFEHIGTQPAKEVLQKLAAGAPETLRTEEAKAALGRLAK